MYKYFDFFIACICGNQKEILQNWFNPQIPPFDK